MESKKHGPMALPKTWVLGLGVLAFYIIFVGLYLLVWETHTSWQTVLNRISWSSADAVAIASISLALYTYWLYEKASKDSDLKYLSEFVFEMKDCGVKPCDIRPLMTTMMSVVSNLGNDPEFQARLQKATARVTKEQFERLKRLDEDELYELLRSGGGKLL